jgi:predicted ATPase/transcriptional regulator with XRE-family HTH domain
MPATVALVRAEDTRVDGALLTALTPPLASVGARLRRLRERAGLSQEALAERAGLGLTTLKALERDRRQRPHAHTLMRLADALGLAAAERTAMLELASGLVDQGRGAPWPAAVAPASARSERLPVAPTPLIGRDAEVVQITTLLDPSHATTRLVTLIGPGGVGKTRLALAVASELIAAYPDGTAFVDLTPLHEARLVPATIARALGVVEGGGRSARELVEEYLRERQLLLVLDNFEHLPEAAPLVAELLQGCARVAVLVTSRTALRLRAERRWPVAPLATPPKDLVSLVEVAASPAARLFVERAQAVAPDFALRESNAAAVAAVCRRLDGMPLAIELAAARAGLLQPAALLRRLEHRLRVLTSGSIDLPARQRTLRNAIAWSYDLLGQPEQVLFRRLSVFVGGWTLMAAEAVCADAELAGDEVTNRLQVLVDSSLVYGLEDGDGEPRFGMLETIREFALDQLDAAEPPGQPGALSTRRRHATFFLELAHRVAPELVRSDQLAWLKRLDREQANCGAAVAWSCREGDQAGLAVELVAILWPIWAMRGYLSEGRAWLAEALAMAATTRGPDAQPIDQWRTVALRGAGVLALRQSDYPAARTCLEQSLALAQACADLVGTAAAFQSLGRLALDEGRLDQAEVAYTRSLFLFDQRGHSHDVAEVLDGLINVARCRGDFKEALALVERALPLHREPANTRGLATLLRQLATLLRDQGRLPEARAAGEECLALWRQLGDPWGIAYALNALGNAARDDADYATATAVLEECLAIQHQLGERQGAAYTLHQLGMIARDRGDLATARRLAEESLTEFRALGHQRGIAYALTRLGHVLHQAGEGRAARAALGESLELQAALGDKRGLAVVFEELAPCALACGRASDAAQLLDAASELRSSTRVPLTVAEASRQQQIRDAVDAALHPCSTAPAPPATIVTLAAAIALARDVAGAV